MKSLLPYLIKEVSKKGLDFIKKNTPTNVPTRPNKEDFANVGKYLQKQYASTVNGDPNKLPWKQSTGDVLELAKGVERGVNKAKDVYRKVSYSISHPTKRRVR
jgi:hypothetical protein